MSMSRELWYVFQCTERDPRFVAHRMLLGALTLCYIWAYVAKYIYS